MNKSLLRTLGGAALGSAAALLGIVLHQQGSLEAVESVAGDVRARLLANPVSPQSPVKLIVLDQQSVDWGAEHYQFTKNWPRNAYAPIIEFCKNGGAKVVTFDVLFQEPAQNPDEDELLGKAVGDCPGFLAAVLPSDTPVGAATAWPEGAPDRFKAQNARAAAQDSAEMNLAVAAFSIPQVTNAAAALGHVRGISLMESKDPIVRRIPAIQHFDRRVLPSLGLAAYAMGRGQSQFTLDEAGLRVGDRSFPVDSRGRFILHYRRPASIERNAFTFEAFSAAAVLQSQLKIRKNEKPQIDPAVFKDAYVFFGFSAQRLYDLTSTPIAAQTPGVEVHATLLDNLLAGDLLRPPGDAAVILFTLLISIAATIGVMRCTRASLAVAVALLAIPAPAAAALLAYTQNLDWPIVPPTLAVAVALIAGGVANYATEGRQRLFISRAFRHYLSPKVIDQVLEDPARLKLGGERRELSIFFSDLAGFTTLSQSLDPQQLADLLNEYLTDMTDIIHSEDGTLDKYEGDAIIAFWNAPVDQPDHAIRACRAAVRCQRKLAERRPDYLKRIGHELHMRIGLHSGLVSVGNFGSRDHFDYTMIGDAANLASRLEGANKAFGTITMVSEALWQQCRQQFQGREIGRVKVVGRDSLVRVFEPSALEGEELDPAVVAFIQAQNLCRTGDWAAAAVALQALPEDPLAQTYLHRLREMQQAGVTQWDDVWSLTSK